MEAFIFVLIGMVFLTIFVAMGMMVADYYKNECRHEEQLDEDNYNKTINTEFEDNYNTTQEFDKDE